MTTASMVASSSLQSGILAPSMTIPSGPPCSSTNKLALVPGLPRSVGFLPTFFPPEPGLAHAAIGTLPVPVDLAEFLALLGEDGPNFLHHAVAAPTLEPTVNGAIGTELLRQAVPLTAAAKAGDDTVEHLPPILGRLSALGAGLPILSQNGFDACPEFIADFPDGRKRLGLKTLP